VAELRHRQRRPGPVVAQGGRGHGGRRARTCWESLKSYEPGVQLRPPRWSARRSGKELGEQGRAAALFAFLMILAYVAIASSGSSPSGSIVAALHEPILVLGFFAATQMPFDLRPRSRPSSRWSATRSTDTVVGVRPHPRTLPDDRKGTSTEIIRPGDQRHAVAHLDDQRHDADRGVRACWSSRATRWPASRLRSPSVCSWARTRRSSWRVPSRSTWNLSARD